MNFLDIGIFLVLFYNAFNGLRKGLIRGIFEIAALVGGIIIAMMYYAKVGEGSSRLLGVHFNYSSVISFIILWCLSFFIILLIGRFIENLLTISLFGSVNLLGGMLFGLFKGFIVLLPFILPMLYFNFPFAKDSFFINSLKPAFVFVLKNYIPQQMFELKNPVVDINTIKSMAPVIPILEIKNNEKSQDKVFEKQQNQSIKEKKEVINQKKPDKILAKKQFTVVTSKKQVTKKTFNKNIKNAQKEIKKKDVKKNNNRVEPKKKRN